MARVLFLQTIQFEFVGVMSIAAYLKKAGHQVDLLLAFFPRLRNISPT